MRPYFFWRINLQEEVGSKIVQATEFRNIAKKIITTLESKGFKLVRIKKLEGKKNIFQIMVEKVDFKPVSIENCAKISKIISNILDLEDPIKDNYYLEISSPGIERPLIEQLDFKRYKGNLIKVKVSNSENFIWNADSKEDFIKKPLDWPQTRYEKKALLKGNNPIFLIFTKKKNKHY